MADIYTSKAISPQYRSSFRASQAQYDDKSKELQQMAMKEKQEADYLYENGLKLATSQNMDEMYRMYENDPAELEKKFSDLNNKMSSEIDDPVARTNFKTNFILQSQSYLNRARGNQKRIQEKRKKQQREQSLIDNTNLLGTAFYNMLSADATPDDVTNFARAKESVEKIITSRNDDGTFVYSPLQQENIREKIKKSQIDSVEEFFNNLPEYEKENFDKTLEDDDAVVESAIIDEQGNIAAKPVSIKNFLDDEQIKEVKKYTRKYKEKVEKKIKSGKTPERSQEETIANLVALNELDTIKKSMQEKKQWKPELKVSDFLEYRNRIKEYRLNDTINDKEYAKLMAETVNPLLDRINTYDPEKGLPDPNMGKVYMSVMKWIDPKDTFSPEQKAYILNQAYDKLIKANLDPNEGYDSDNKEIIGKISSQIRQDYAVDLDPAILNKNIDKVVFGSNIFDYNEGAGIQSIKGSEAEYRKSPDGHIYKIVRNKYGEPINKILVR